MIIINTILFFSTLVIPGYLIMSLLDNSKKPLLHNLAISYGLGTFFISMQIFLYIFLFKQIFNIYYFSIILFLEIILLLCIAVKNKRLTKIKFPSLRMGSVEFIILLLIVVQIFFAMSNGITRPVATYDSMAGWSYKAKVLYYEKGIDFNPDSYLYLGGGGHINYPWLVPISQFWLHEVLGEYNDLAINIIFVSFYISTLIILFYFLRNYLDKFKSLIFTFMLSSMPLFFYHSFNAYADLVLSFYTLIAFIYLYEWFRKLKTKDLVIAGLFFGISFWVKNEAIIFIFASLALVTGKVILEKINYKNIYYYIVSFFLVIFPWLFYKFIYKLSFNNIETAPGFHPEVFKSIINSLFLSNSWNIWWYIVVIVFVLNFKKIIKRNDLKMAWFFLFISISAFLVLYLFTEAYQFAVNDTALSRNILTLIPVSVAIVGLSFSKKENI